MSRSLSMTANFVFKLHTMALEAPSEGIVRYPVMDGIFVTARSRKHITDFLHNVFRRAAESFLVETEFHHRFVIKAALAYGPVIHGVDIPAAASQTLANSDYRRSLLLGMPMVQAYESETRAPPLGVYIHESGRAFAPSGDQVFTQAWWEWWGTDVAIRDRMSTSVDVYYAWAKEHHYSLEYPLDRLAVHAEMAREYFLGVSNRLRLLDGSVEMPDTGIVSSVVPDGGVPSAEAAH
jgi:hypothetical protein